MSLSYYSDLFESCLTFFFCVYSHLKLISWFIWIQTQGHLHYHSSKSAGAKIIFLIREKMPLSVTKDRPSNHCNNVFLFRSTHTHDMMIIFVLALLRVFFFVTFFSLLQCLEQKENINAAHHHFVLFCLTNHSNMPLLHIFVFSNDIKRRIYKKNVLR